MLRDICAGCFRPDAEHIPTCTKALMRRKAACFDWEEAHPQYGIGWSRKHKNWYVFDKVDHRLIATGDTRLACVEEAAKIP